MIVLKRYGIITAVLLALGGCGITAPHSNPAYVDLDALSWRDVDTVMALSFGPTALGLAALAMDEDPAAQALLRSLEGIRIRVYEVEGDPEKVAAGLNDLSLELRSVGWEPAIRVQEGKEVSHVLIKMSGEDIAGLTVLTSDSLEAVLINVMGNLSPAQLDKTMVALELPASGIDTSAAETSTL